MRILNSLSAEIHKRGDLWDFQTSIVPKYQKIEGYNQQKPFGTIKKFSKVSAE